MPIHFNITGGASKFGNDTSNTIEVSSNQTIQNQINTALERTEGLTQNKLIVSNGAGILTTSSIASDAVLEKTNPNPQTLAGNLETKGLTIARDDELNSIIFKKPDELVYSIRLGKESDDTNDKFKVANAYSTKKVCLDLVPASGSTLQPEYQINGQQISSSDLADGTTLLKSDATNVQNLSNTLEFNTDTNSNDIFLKHQDNDTYSVRLGKFENDEYQKFLVGHSDSTKKLALNLWSNAGDIERPEYQIGGEKISSADLSNDDNLVKKDETTVFKTTASAGCVEINPTGSIEIVSPLGSVGGNPFIDYKVNGTEDFRVRTVYNDDDRHFVIEGIGVNGNYGQSVDLNIKGHSTDKPKILINGVQLSTTDLSDGATFATSADLITLQNTVNNNQLSADASINQAVANVDTSILEQPPADGYQGLKETFKTGFSTNTNFDGKIKVVNPNYSIGGNTTMNIESESDNFGLNIKNDLTGPATKPKIYLNDTQISSSDLSDESNLAKQSDITSLQTDITTLQNNSGGGSSSYNPILLLKKTDYQQIPNHSQTNVTYNVIEHQSTDNTITYSNGYITTADIGVYEVTFDVSFSQDLDNPLDPGPREAYIKCSDFPNEKLGYDRRVSPADSDTNDIVRYTSSCYVKTTSVGATLSLWVYQNNSDGDGLNTLTYTTTHFARLSCRRVA